MFSSGTYRTRAPVVRCNIVNVQFSKALSFYQFLWRIETSGECFFMCPYVYSIRTTETVVIFILYVFTKVAYLLSMSAAEY